MPTTQRFYETIIDIYAHDTEYRNKVIHWSFQRLNSYTLSPRVIVKAVTIEQLQQSNFQLPCPIPATSQGNNDE